MGHESVDIEIILYYKLNSFYLCRQKSSYSHGQVYYYVKSAYLVYCSSCVISHVVSRKGGPFKQGPLYCYYHKVVENHYQT